MQKIIIDTDPGIDDALAILLALAAKDELDVLALTTVNGNVGVEQVTKNAFKILEIAGRTDIPVYMGNGKPLMRENEHCEEFHGDDGMGNLEMPDCHKIPENENAVDFLIRKVREEKGEITLVPIGPLTNIAEAIQKNSDFVKNVKEVVIMGGAEHGGNMSPHAEFNFWTDPEAAKIVFQAGFEKVTMIGLDATSYVFLSPTLRELLYLINTPISRFIHKITRVYADGHWEVEKKLGCGKPYFLLWLKSIFLICVICFVLQSLFIPGEQIIWKVWVFSIKVESVQKAIILCSRILGIGSAILLGGKLIDIKKLMIVLEKKGMSSSVTYVLLSTTNIIPQMSKKMGAILEAQKSRGIETDSNMIVRAKAFFPSVGPLLLNSLVNAEERAITLEARAFSAPCKKTSLKNVEDSSRDKMLRIVFIAATILAIGGKIVLWIV